MKLLFSRSGARMFYYTLVLLFVQVIVFGQEEGGSTTTTSTDITVTESTTESWYASPWVWVAGAAVFILLLVALLRSGGDRTVSRDSERVVVKKTVDRDGDPDTV